LALREQIINFTKIGINNNLGNPPLARAHRFRDLFLFPSNERLGQNYVPLSSAFRKPFEGIDAIQPFNSFRRFSCPDEKYPLEFRYTLETNSFVPIMPLSVKYLVR